MCPRHRPGQGRPPKGRELSPVAEVLLSRDSWRCWCCCCSITCLRSNHKGVRTSLCQSLGCRVRLPRGPPGSAVSPPRPSLGSDCQACCPRLHRPSCDQSRPPPRAVPAAPHKGSPPSRVTKCPPGWTSLQAVRGLTASADMTSGATNAHCTWVSSRGQWEAVWPCWVTPAGTTSWLLAGGAWVALQGRASEDTGPGACA